MTSGDRRAVRVTMIVPALLPARFLRQQSQRLKTSRIVHVLAHTAEQRGLRFLPLQPAAGIKNALCRQQFAGDGYRFPRQRVALPVEPARLFRRLLEHQALALAHRHQLAVIAPAKILFLSVMPDIAPLSQLARAIEYITHPALQPLAEPAPDALIHRPGLRLQVAARRILHKLPQRTVRRGMGRQTPHRIVSVTIAAPQAVI